MLLSNNQSIIILILFFIALFIAEIVFISTSGNIHICMELKVIPQHYQLVFMNFCFSAGIQIGKYSPVFSKDIMNITNKINIIPVYLVMVAIPALIGTEFLI